MDRNFNSKPLYIVCLFSLFPFLAFKWNELFNFYSAYSDIAAHYMLYIFKDFNLFPDDLFVNYLKHGITSWTKGMLYIWIFNWFYGLNSLLALVISPIILLKIWVCLQFFVSSVLIFFITCEKRAQQGLWVLFFYFILSFTMDIFQGGLPRGFGEVVIVIYIYFFIQEKYAACWKTTACTLFIYPHLLPFMICNLILFSNFKISRRTILWGIATTVFLLLSFLVFPIYQNDILNDQAKLAYSSYRYLLPEGYSSSIFSEVYILLGNFLNFADHPGPYPIVVSFFILGAAFLFVKNYHSIIYSRLSVRFLQLFAGAVICYTLLCLTGMMLGTKVFYFHIAGKQTKYFLPIFLSFICGFGYSRQFNNKFVLLFCYAVFILITAYPQQNYNLDLSSYKKTYSFIKTLPPDSMILGDFQDTEFIPLYCKRQSYWMFIWTELSANNAFHHEKERRASLLKDAAYYNSPLLKQMLHSEKITHLFINRDRPFLSMKAVHILVQEQIIKPVFMDMNYILYEILLPKSKET